MLNYIIPIILDYCSDFLKSMYLCTGVTSDEGLGRVKGAGTGEHCMEVEGTGEHCTDSAGLVISGVASGRLGIEASSELTPGDEGKSIASRASSSLHSS